MASPFDLIEEAPAPAATENQLRYLRDLMVAKAQLLDKDMSEAVPAIDAWFERGLTKPYASQMIDSTRRVLDQLRANNGAKAKRIVDHLGEEIEDGFYELPDGRIAKVIHAVHGSGHQYAKLFNPTTGKFDMAMGLIRQVRIDGRRIDTDQQRASELGKLYGVCMCCGLTLTNEESIADGIGPICRTKRGW